MVITTPSEVFDLDKSSIIPNHMIQVELTPEILKGRVVCTEKKTRDARLNPKSRLI